MHILIEIVVLVHGDEDIHVSVNVGIIVHPGFAYP
jgi:hypothetical protein